MRRDHELHLKALDRACDSSSNRCTDGHMVGIWVGVDVSVTCVACHTSCLPKAPCHACHTRAVQTALLNRYEPRAPQAVYRPCVLRMLG